MISQNVLKALATITRELYDVACEQDDQERSKECEDR